MSVSTSGECADCGTVLTGEYLANDGSRKPCPNCGSMKRHYRVEANATVTARVSMGYKMKRQGKGRPVLEGKQGASLRRDDGKWVEIQQVVDRENNKYKKKIVDPETGAVIRDEDGKLTDHQGYGSAKTPNKHP